MTNSEAIKYLSALPPDAVAPMRYAFESPPDVETGIVLGRISVRFLPNASGCFLLGRDAVILIDGRELDFALIESATIRFIATGIVKLDLALVPQSGTSSDAEPVIDAEKLEDLLEDEGIITAQEFNELAQAATVQPEPPVTTE